MARASRALPVSGALVAFVGLLAYAACGPPALVGCGQVTGYGPATLELLSACPQVVERLGQPVEFRLLAFGHGNYASGPSEGGAGHAWGRLSVRGPSGTASLDYDLSKGGGAWHPSVLVVTWPDGEKLDVQACTQSLQVERGAAAMRRLLSEACERGMAAQCATLASVLAASGDPEAAATARARACQLGLQSACSPGAP